MQIREYHSSVRAFSPVSYISKPLSSYLYEIKLIIDNNNSEVAQQKIEEEWIDIIKTKMQNDKDFVKKYGNLFSSQISKISEVLNTSSLNSNLNKRFSTIPEELNKIELIGLTFSLLTIFYDKLELTTLCTLVG